MRVLIIIPANISKQDNVLGYSTFLRTEIDCLKNKVDELEVYYFTKRNGIIDFFKSLSELNKLIKKFKPEIIHSHYGSSTGLLVAFAQRNCPWIITFGGSELLGHPNKGFLWKLRGSMAVFFSKYAATKAEEIICVSKNLEEVLKPSLRKKVTIIPRGVNNLFFSTDLRKEGSLDRNRILFSLPRLNAEVKNLPLALEVIKDYNSRYNGNLKLEVMNSLSQVEIKKLFNTSGLLLVTSLHEGSPNIVKEAMACDLPIVSVNCGDVEFLLENVDNSFCAETYNVAELSSLMRTVLLNNNTYSNGRQKLIEKELDIESCSNKITKRYKKLIV